jgi:hypothetical protein
LKKKGRGFLSGQLRIEVDALNPLEAWHMALDVQIGHPVFCIVSQPSDPQASLLDRRPPVAFEKAIAAHVSHKARIGRPPQRRKSIFLLEEKFLLVAGGADGLHLQRRLALDHSDFVSELILRGPSLSRTPARIRRARLRRTQLLLPSAATKKIPVCSSGCRILFHYRTNHHGAS